MLQLPEGGILPLNPSPPGEALDETRGGGRMKWDKVRRGGGEGSRTEEPVGGRIRPEKVD